MRKELTMVAKAFEDEALPADFAADVRKLLEGANVLRMDVHREAARRLAAIGPAAVEPLCQALEDQRPLVRKVAAKALCLIGDGRALEPMVRMLLSPGDQAMHNADLLYYQPTVLSIPGMREELLKTVRRAAEVPAGALLYIIILLGRYCTDAETTETLLAAFRSDKLPAQARNQALGAICKRQPETADELALEGFGQRDLIVPCGEAWGLAERWEMLIPIDLCLPYVGAGPLSELRLQAVRLIRQHGEQGRRVIDELLGSGSLDEQATVALALADSQRPELFDILKRELLHGHQGGNWPTFVAKRTLWHYADQVLSWSQAATHEEARRPPVAWLFARARLWKGQATEADILRCGGPHARKAVLRKVVARQRAEAIPELRRCLREAGPQQVTREAFRQMRRMKNAAMPAVLEMLESEHWGQRKAAVGLLRQWGTLTDAQRDRALADPHIAVRHAAVGHR